jgi:hypothetical protein
MSTLKADAVTSSQDNTALTLSGRGTGGVKVNDFFVQTKGSDISSATSLTLGKDGNQFDVTGTTTITSIATQGIGSYVTLHFDGALTFTHHSTNLILPGAANITTAAGDIAVMYEYASADWRCVSYTKASGAAVVAASSGFTLGTEQATTSGTAKTFTGIPAGTKMITISFHGVSASSTSGFEVTIGDSGGLETSGYVGGLGNIISTTAASENATDAFLAIGVAVEAMNHHGTMILTLEDSSDYTWTMNGNFTSHDNTDGGISFSSGSKSLSAELTQLSVTANGDTFTAGVVNIMYQ